MIQYLQLTNEQAIVLYDILANLALDRAKNRNRWKFLDVIEDKVISYEDLRNSKLKTLSNAKQLNQVSLKDPNLTIEVRTQLQQALNETEDKIIKELQDLGKESIEFSFNDREIFSQGKALFETVSKLGDKDNDFAGQKSKLYKEIEDAFLVVRQVEENK